MQEINMELVVGGVPYFVKVVPFSFNTETRFRVRYNSSDEHIFTWDSRIGRLAAIDDEAGDIPVEVERAIAEKIQAGKY